MEGKGMEKGNTCEWMQRSEEDEREVGVVLYMVIMVVDFSGWLPWIPSYTINKSGTGKWSGVKV